MGTLSELENANVLEHLLTHDGDIVEYLIANGTPSMTAYGALLMFWTDGIINVSAKDKATGKDQSMTIASSSSLSDKEIKHIVVNVKQYAKQDKTRHDIIKESNKA